MKPDEHSERRDESPKVKPIELQIEELSRRLILSEGRIASDAAQCLDRAEKNGARYGANRAISGNARVPEETDQWLTESIERIKALVVALDQIPGDPPVTRVLRQRLYVNTENPALVSALVSLETDDRRSAIFYDDQIQVLPKGATAMMFISNYRTFSSEPFSSEPVFSRKAADIVLAEILTKALSPVLTYPVHRSYGDFIMKSSINRIAQGPPESLRQILFQRIEILRHLRSPPDFEVAQQLKVMTQNGEFYLVVGFDKCGLVKCLFD